MRQKVLLGMSGGIDSSVAAMVLQEQGFEVVGITFIFSGSDMKDFYHSADSAKMLAGKLGIEHYVVDLREEFKNQVIRYFINEYSSGNTPFSCAVCNPKLKFYNLKKYADKLSCNFISTGHYVNIIEIEGVKYISSGKDRNKDQSFFLWGLQKELINRFIFPLGDLYKNDVREIAQQKGFEDLTQKKESLGICFIEGKDYRKYLENSGLNLIPGNFTDLKGKVIGKHKGVFHYTIGQRRGLGVHFNKPVFVAEIKTESNEVVLADFDEMFRSKIFLNNTHFVDKNSVDFNKTYTVKIRYRLQQNLCKLKLLDGCNAQIELEKPVAMVANGQTAVIYDEDCVIGGGFIESSE